MSRMDRAMRRGLAAIKRSAAVPVTYHRGEESIALLAVRGTSQANDLHSESLRLGTTTADYLIDAADLDFGDGPVEPAIGDRITDDGREFEVIVMASGDRPWRWHDRIGHRRRIHTVER